MSVLAISVVLMAGAMSDLSYGLHPDMSHVVRMFSEKLHDNRGYFTNCGDKSHNFTLWWEPKDLPSTVQLVKMGAQITAPVAMSSGHVTLSLYLAQVPDQPILSTTYSGTCDDIRKFVPLLKCPIKAGDKLAYSDNVKNSNEIPEGAYIVKAELYNENNQQFICAQADITITD